MMSVFLNPNLAIGLDEKSALPEWSYVIPGEERGGCQTRFLPIKSIVLVPCS